jgi:DNA-binding transcriptional LysR family regulator
MSSIQFSMVWNTLDGLEALAALERFGTVSEAAIRLRLTQSAVSKRIQALQKALGFRVVEPDGRRVRLTAEAVSLLERARPLVAELRSLATPVGGESAARFSLGLADSIAASWGPAVVAEALRALPGVEVDLHAHRSVLLIESVRLGRYHIVLSSDVPTTAELIHYPVIDEPMLLINAGCRPKAEKGAPLITIEASSATWRAIEPALHERHPQLLARRIVPVESFSAALQMVKAGFGDGLAPLGLALETGLDRRCCRALPGVERRVSLLTRKTVNQLASFAKLRDALISATAARFARYR